MSKARKRGQRIIVDILALAYEGTGIKTYIQGLISAIELGRDTDLVFKFTPAPSQIPNWQWLSQLKTSRLNWLFHVLYFVWKQLILPVSAKVFRADVVLVSDYVLPAWKTSSLKLVVMHDAFLWNHPETFGHFWRNYYIRLINAGLSSKAVAITVSNYSRNRLEPHLPKQIPIEIIYPFTSLKRIDLDLDLNELLKELKLEKGKYIFHAGLIDPRKDLQTLIKALAIISRNGRLDYKLVLAGRVDSNNLEFRAIMEIIEENDLEAVVVFTGYVKEQILMKLYHGAGLYVFPSKDEGFGLPVLEAMAFGVPVIVSDSGSLPEIGGEAVEVFTTGDSQELANMIMTLFEDPEKRRKLVEKGYKRQTEFNSKRYWDQLKLVILHYTT